jgi:hypothetical protein
MSNIRLEIAGALLFIAGTLVGWGIWSPSSRLSKPPVVKQPIDHERYYCHETGFLMHHAKDYKGINWEDHLVLNKFEEPTKCEEK